MPDSLDARAADSPLPAGEGARPARLLRYFPATICFAVAIVFTFARVISEKIYSDEQLFLGGAGLMARGNGLIYRDFFYNHMPTHALVLATLFKFTVHWTLAARTFDALCAAGIVTVLFEAARRSLINTTMFWRIALGASVAAIFLFNPVTADAVGKAWNHDLAALSCLLGFVILAAGLERERPALWLVTSGMCAAIAVTSRLTFAPPLIAFPILILIAPGRSFAARVKLTCLFALGGLIGAAPALLVIAQSPANAYFENVKFPGLTTRYQGELKFGQRDTFLRKLDFIRRTAAKSWALNILFWLTVTITVAQAFPPVIQRLRLRRTQTGMSVPLADGGMPARLIRARMFSIVVLVLAAGVAAFVPTPMYNQYLYGPIPFAALLIAWGIASLGIERFIVARIAIVALAIICIVSARDQYAGVGLIASPTQWSPNVSHKDGKRLARLAAPGRVLTFMPGVALEAGLPIYPELSIGRYAARIADYLTPEQREKMNVPDSAAIRSWFETDHPGAILLVDPDSAQEIAIADIAKSHGYVAQPFGNDWILYLPPDRVPQAHD